MHLARPTTRVALIGLGAMLLAAGLALWFERLRADGTLRLWPIVLLIVGTAKVGSGPSDQREEGLWLIGTGVWLLIETLAPVMLRGVEPLLVMAAGFFAFRWAGVWSPGDGLPAPRPMSARGNAHVN